MRMWRRFWRAWRTQRARIDAVEHQLAALQVAVLDTGRRVTVLEIAGAPRSTPTATSGSALVASLKAIQQDGERAPRSARVVEAVMRRAGGDAALRRYLLAIADEMRTGGMTEAEIEQRILDGEAA